jgi:hypothetical protein
MKSKIHIKIHIKTFKTLLHVSILRPSSGSIHCSLLKLYIKIISELLRYISANNFSKTVQYRIQYRPFCCCSDCHTRTNEQTDSLGKSDRRSFTFLKYIIDNAP